MEKCPECDLKGFPGQMKMHKWKHWSAPKSTSLCNWIDGVTNQSSMYGAELAPSTAQLEAWLAEKQDVADLTFALIWCVKSQRMEFCDMLTKAGANVNLQEPRLHDTTATKMAMLAGEDMARYIFLKGGNPKEPGCITTAGLYGHFELVKLLVMAGADFSSPVNGETPVQAILERGEENKHEIAKFLQEEAPGLAVICGHKGGASTDEKKAAAPAAASAAAASAAPGAAAIAVATNAPAPASNGKRVMISYQWADQPVIKALAASLQSAGYNVWLDLEQMSGSTLSAMAEAVEGSEVVIVGMSSKYQNSKNCRLEGEYAHLNSKVIVPLMMESNFRPTGWLGLIIGGRLWFDFTAPERQETSYQGLVNELKRAIGPPSGTATFAPPPPPPASTPAAPAPAPAPAPVNIDKFAAIADVGAWLKERGINTRVELDAVCLSELAAMRAKEGSSVTFANFLLTHITQLDAASALRLSNALSK